MFIWTGLCVYFYSSGSLWVDCAGKFVGTAVSALLPVLNFTFDSWYMVHGTWVKTEVGGWTGQVRSGLE